jgi:cytochrome c
MRIKRAHLGLLIAFVAVVALTGGVVAIHHGFSARDNPSGIEKVMARTMRSLAVPSRAKYMNNSVPNTPENLQKATAHWADHCAFCHANNGSGDTEVGRNLYPKAPDMRLPDTQKLTDGELYYTIKNGIRLTGMPAWGAPGDADEDSWKLVYFIRHLPKMTAQEAEDMKKLNPQSPMEKMEEQEEEQFLEGGTPPPQSRMQHTNKGEKK